MGIDWTRQLQGRGGDLTKSHRPLAWMGCGLLSMAVASASAGDSVPAEHEVAPALAFGPLVAESLQSTARITLVASRSSAVQSPRTVHALIERPGQLVSWVRLPMEELPESAFIISDDRFVCVTRRGDDDTELITLDDEGHSHERTLLSGLLPDESLRTDESMALTATPMGPCLTVPLACGTLALVEMRTERSVGVGTVQQPPFFRVCSVILSDKHACGVDAWLAQARQLDREGDDAAAKFALEAAIETDPSDARGYRELAKFYRRRGAAQEQLLCLQAGVARLHEGTLGYADDDWQVGTPAARLVLDYVSAAHAIDDENKAHEALHTALSLYPCMEQVVLLRADSLLSEDEPAAAVASLREALAQLDPNADLAAATHDAGRFLARRGYQAEALLFLEDAFALGDDSDFLLRSLADVSLELGDPARAAGWLVMLASRWRSLKNGESGASRSERAQQRIRALDAEIAELHLAAAKLAE